jgi:septum site-determining protein MinC
VTTTATTPATPATTPAAISAIAASPPPPARQSIRFRARSFIAFALTPEVPIAGWLTDLDTWIANSPGFFVGRPVVLDLAAAGLSGSGIAHLISELGERDIRIMGLEGADPAQLGPSLPPLLNGGRAAAGEGASESRSPAPAPAPTAARPTRRQSLVLDSPVRSGQSVIFPDGDVTVIGSVASGAEVVAGGSIHVHGALRGRALAGSTGDASARIFCRKNEAELLAIDGFYQTAEEMDPKLRSHPVQAFLDDGLLSIAALD